MRSLESRGWEYLENRFGVRREKLENYRLEERSGDLWLVSGQLKTGLEAETVGFRFIRQTGRGLKPTTYALQFLGDRIEKNLVTVEREELVKLLEREEMVERKRESDGYVALKFEERIIGCGFYKAGKVSSRVPKGRGKELARTLSR